MSCSICPGFNVSWWYHAVDTPSTVWFNDWRVVVNSVTDIYSHHHVHTLKYLHTVRSCRFYPYRKPLTHLHCSIHTIIPMPMKQPWRLWVYKPQESNRNAYIKSNKTQQNHVRILRVILHHRGIIPTAQIIAAYEFCARNWQLFFKLCWR